MSSPQPPAAGTVCDTCGDHSDSAPGLPCGRVEDDDNADDQAGTPCPGTYRFVTPTPSCHCAQRQDENGQPLRPDIYTCGHCARTWCGRCYPVPAARCPFEYDHAASDDAEDSDGGVPELSWQAGARTGVLPTDDEGTITLLLDGEPLVGIDLEAGQIGTWPDGRTWRTIARFGPALDPPRRHLNLLPPVAEIIQLRPPTPGAQPPSPTTEGPA